MLEAARSEGASLIVALNSDHSARRLGKGPERPVVSEAARARVVAGFAAVDCVVLFDQPTPLELIERLQPDVLVKGGDYEVSSIVGSENVISRGGRVVVVPLIPDLSTTRLVERLRDPS